MARDASTPVSAQVAALRCKIKRRIRRAGIDINPYATTAEMASILRYIASKEGSK